MPPEVSFLLFLLADEKKIMSFFTNLASQVNNFFDSSAAETQDENPDDDFIEQQLLNEKHRYDSFAAVRHDAQVKYYIDGQNYCW